METLNHSVVEDRVIFGQGTTYQQWLDALIEHPIANLDLDQLFACRKRCVIVSPHPDDEVLGCAGLMQHLLQRGIEVWVLAVTHGTQSHPNSTKYSVAELDRKRPLESQQALAALAEPFGNHIHYHSLHLQDGQLQQQKAELYEALTQLLHADDVVVGPYERDGHPDHEATGEVLLQVAYHFQIPCLRVLIWALHWASPFDSRIRWNIAHAVPLSEQQLQQKREAIQFFHSQIEADESTGQPPIVPAYVIERMLLPWEIYLYAS